MLRFDEFRTPQFVTRPRLQSKKTEGPHAHGSSSVPSALRHPRDTLPDLRNAARLRNLPGGFALGVAPIPGPEGRALPGPVRALLERRSGHDLGQVRIHTGAAAQKPAQALRARAFTIGQDIVIGAGQYAPYTRQGLQLLAHEVAHTIQQGSARAEAPLLTGEANSLHEQQARAFAADVTNSGSGHSRQSSVSLSRVGPSVQRDLLAYETSQTKVESRAVPVQGGGVPIVRSETYEGAAPGLRAALHDLIAAGKIDYSLSGGRVEFSNASASRAEIEAALAGAGYAKASEMTAALVDKHNVYLYSSEKVTRLQTLFPVEVGRQKDVIERSTTRSMTRYEKIEASRVFHDRLDFDKITLSEDRIMSMGGYARTLPGTIYFPPGSFGSPGFIPWLIHELTHVWQYTRGYTVWQTLYHALTGFYAYGGEAGLIAAAKAGVKFTDFNTEQQGDILRDYYVRLTQGADTVAWEPFVAEMLGKQAKK